MAWLILACGNEDDPIPTEGLDSRIKINNGEGQFDNIIESESGDDFELMSAVLHTDYIEIDVAYSGGCKEHNFELVYKAPDSSDLVEIAIVHDSNGDLCEAYLNETIRIELADFPQIADSLSIGQTLRLINGSNHKSIVIYQGLSSFAEGETCELNVTAEDVICGDGLFDNRWLKFDVTADGHPVYFQPVSLASLILLNDKIETGEYLVAVKLSEPFIPDPDIAICQAYPGPSIPVSIWCIEAKK